MKKTSEPSEPDEERNIFTEGIDYLKTDRASIWGPGDEDTLDLIEKTDIHGKWLNLAAGDGRYNLNLLEKADFIIASDLDKSALLKLWENTPLQYREKLETQVFDITQRFPFQDETFDGVFCASTIHYFSKKIIEQIISEIDRTVKPGGKVFIEFATDIRRVFSNGRLYTRKSEPLYTYKQGIMLLEEVLQNYEIEIVKSQVPPEQIVTQRSAYQLSCNLIILIGCKTDKK